MRRPELPSVETYDPDRVQRQLMGSDGVVNHNAVEHGRPYNAGMIQEVMAGGTPWEEGPHYGANKIGLETVKAPAPPTTGYTEKARDFREGIPESKIALTGIAKAALTGKVREAVARGRLRRSTRLANENERKNRAERSITETALNKGWAGTNQPDNEHRPTGYFEKRRVKRIDRLAHRNRAAENTINRMKASRADRTYTTVKKPKRTVIGTKKKDTHGNVIMNEVEKKAPRSTSEGIHALKTNVGIGYLRARNFRRRNVIHGITPGIRKSVRRRDRHARRAEERKTELGI